MKIVVVGAGVSGLATAHALLAAEPGLDLLVLESESRVGGKVQTQRTPEGFLLEGGVNAFLDNKPKTLELAARLHLYPIRSFDASRKRFIYSEGRLKKLPESPPAFLSSDLLSLPGRLRVLMEPFISRGRDGDETLAEFATRRLGREAYEKLIDPMASGVYAGDATKLSLRSCFPRIHEIEQEYGSLIRGLIRLQIAARREGKKEGPSAGPGGKLTTFEDGMGALTNALAEQLGDRVRIGTPVEGIGRSGKLYTVHTQSGVEEADSVILAVPAYVQSEILKDLIPRTLTDRLRRIFYPPLAVCSLGYRKEIVGRDLNGFGFLVPSSEKRKILGTLWDTSIFPNRAPEGYVLLRSMVGGARYPGLAMEPEDKIVEMVRSEVREIMGLSAEPDFARVFRHERSIPQYGVSHSEMLNALDEAAGKHPGLVLSGNAYRGVALNDCVANAQVAARRVLDELCRA